MRCLLLALFLALGSLSCGGDYTAAMADVQFTPYQAGEADVTLPLPEPEPVPEVPTATDDPTPGTGEEPPAARPDDPPPVDVPPDDGPPPWTEHDDPAVQSCLETYPVICDKLAECGEQMPIVGLLSGFCPTLMDSISPMLQMSCEQVVAALEQALPGVQIPLAGDLQTVIANLIKGCIENLECDPAYLQKLGEKFAAVLSLAGGAAGGGGGMDIGSALPALLDLAAMCGGLDTFLPF